MPQDYDGNDTWPDTIPLLADGDTLDFKTLQLGEIAPIIDRTKWLRARLAQHVTASGDSDPTSVGRGDPVDLFTTTAWVASSAIALLVPNVLPGDLIHVTGSFQAAGDAASTAVFKFKDALDFVPGWTVVTSTAAGLVDAGASDGALLVTVDFVYAVTSAPSVPLRLYARKIAGGDDGFQTFEPWQLTAKVYRP